MLYMKSECACEKDINGLIQQFKEIMSNDVLDEKEVVIQTLENDTPGESHYVTVGSFDSNFINKEFGNISLPKDKMTQLYFFGLAGVCVYILYKIMEKSK